MFGEAPLEIPASWSPSPRGLRGSQHQKESPKSLSDDFPPRFSTKERGIAVTRLGAPTAFGHIRS